MDMGRRGYRTWMKTWLGDDRPAVKVVWYRVPNDRPVYTGPSPFRSRTDEDERGATNPDVGEQWPYEDHPCYEKYGWGPTSEPALYTGRGSCGDEESGRVGGTAGKNAEFWTDDNGRAPCCEWPQLVMGHGTPALTFGGRMQFTEVTFATRGRLGTYGGGMTFGTGGGTVGSGPGLEVRGGLSASGRLGMYATYYRDTPSGYEYVEETPEGTIVTPVYSKAEVDAIVADVVADFAAFAAGLPDVYATKFTLADCLQWSGTVLGCKLPSAGGIAAAGTTQAGATPLASISNIVTGGGGGAGVRLPSGFPQRVAVINKQGLSILLYPPVGGQIDGRAVNEPLFVYGGSGVLLDQAEDGQWSVISQALTNSASPGQPTSLVVTPGNAQLSLTWTAPTGAPPAATYRVFRSANSTMTPQTFVGEYATNTATITGLTNGTTYYVQVVPVSAAGSIGTSSSVGSGTPSAVTTTLYDQFTGSDGTNLTSHTMNTGSGWTVLSGASRIRTNQGQAGTSGGAGTSGTLLARASSSSPDGTAEVTFYGAPFGQTRMALAFRITDANNYWRFQVDTNAFPGWSLIKVVSGTPTVMGTYAGAFSGGPDVVKVTLSGNSIQCRIGTTLAISVTDSAHASATGFGIYAYNDGSTYGYPASFDEFKVTT